MTRALQRSTLLPGPQVARGSSHHLPGLRGVEPLRDGQAHQVIFVKVELEQDVHPPARRPPHAAGSNIGWGPVASCPWPACEAIIRRPAGVPARSMYRHTAVCGPGMTRLIAPSAAGVRHRRSNVLSTSGETQKGPRKKTRRGRPMTIAAKGTQRMPLLSPRLVANPAVQPTFRQPRGCKRPHWSGWPRGEPPSLAGETVVHVLQPPLPTAARPPRGDAHLALVFVKEQQR